jgi:hypothetical protein
MVGNNMAKTPFNAQNDLVQEEAKKRAEQIDATAEKIFQVCLDADITVNDLQVINSQLTQQMNAVFLSRKCSEFIDKK